jgi:hypothetical protein
MASESPVCKLNFASSFSTFQKTSMLHNVAAAEQQHTAAQR